MGNCLRESVNVEVISQPVLAASPLYFTERRIILRDSLRKIEQMIVPGKALEKALGKARGKAREKNKQSIVSRVRREALAVSAEVTELQGILGFNSLPTAVSNSICQIGRRAVDIASRAAELSLVLEKLTST